MIDGSAKTFLLFTYGTLMKGERNEFLLDDAKYIGRVVTTPNYKLFRIDGNFVFPALIDGGNTAIKGELYEVPMSALAGMDRMEGHPHLYCRKYIDIEGANDYAAIAYFFVDKQSLIENYTEIESGDWLNRNACN